MPQSLVEIDVHIVFSTKGREPFLQDRTFRDRTHGYLKGTCDGQNSPSLQIGGVEDHVHILCRLGKTLDASTLIRELKRESSKWIKAENPALQDFYWQIGYGVFGEPVACAGAYEIHRRARRAPSQGVVSGRIPAVVCEIRGRDR